MERRPPLRPSSSLVGSGFRVRTLITAPDLQGTRQNAAKREGSASSPNIVWTLVHFLLRRKAEAFDFALLGPRVPAVIVSPFVPAGAVSPDPRDHACIPATVRALFAPQAGRLTGRDEHAAPFHTLAQLPEPRRGADLPDLSRHLPPAPVTREAMLAAEAVPSGPEPPVPEYYKDFVKLAELVAGELPAAEVAATAAPDLGPRARAHQVTMAFTRHADQARTIPP
jgi:phospholipase C